MGTAVCLLVALSVVRQKLPSKAARLVSFVPLLWIAANAGAMVDGYLGWQSRAAKDKAIVLHLRDNEEARRASVLWVRDEVPRGDEVEYRFYEWASMAELAWGDERHVGFAEGTSPATVAEKVPFLRHSHNAQDVDIEGCAALLVVAPVGPTEPDWRLGVRYSFARLGGGPSAAWLRGLLRLTASPLPTADGRRCQRPVPMPP